MKHGNAQTAGDICQRAESKLRQRAGRWPTGTHYEKCPRVGRVNGKHLLSFQATEFFSRGGGGDHVTDEQQSPSRFDAREKVAYSNDVFNPPVTLASI